jgi:hypothetical protein
MAKRHKPGFGGTPQMGCIMMAVYRLLPKYRCTASGLALLSLASFTTGCIPSASKAFPSANTALAQSLSLETSISMPNGIPLTMAAWCLPILMARPGVLFRFFQTHPADSSNAPTCPAKFCGSDSKVTAISNGVPENGKTAALILATWDSSSFRGALNLSNASWASSARAFASAICTLALAISACATPSSALDLAVSASTTVVRQSDCASRIVVVRHCSNKNAIVAHAPTAVMIPPPKIPFQEIGYQYSAHSNNDGSTATRVYLWFFSALAIVIAAPIAILAFFAVALWLWGPKR